MDRPLHEYCQLILYRISRGWDSRSMYIPPVAPEIIAVRAMMIDRDADFLVFVFVNNLLFLAL
jgi:hypothetical protein